MTNPSGDRPDAGRREPEIPMTDPQLIEAWERFCDAKAAGRSNFHALAAVLENRRSDSVGSDVGANHGATDSVALRGPPLEAPGEPSDEAWLSGILNALERVRPFLPAGVMTQISEAVATYGRALYAKGRASALPEEKP